MPVRVVVLGRVSAHVSEVNAKETAGAKKLLVPLV